MSMNLKKSKYIKHEHTQQNRPPLLYYFSAAQRDLWYQQKHLIHEGGQANHNSVTDTSESYIIQEVLNKGEKVWNVIF